MPAFPQSSKPPSLNSVPGWARAADVLCAALLVLAFAIAEWGGFRVQVAGLRLTATSVPRTLLIALVVALVRHAFVPRPPIYENLPARLLAAWRSRSAASRCAFSAVAGTRLAVLFVGYLAVAMVGYRPGTPPIRLSPNEAANLQARWDANWYFGIATDGYRYAPAVDTPQQNIVFFPAFPALLHL